MSRGRGASGDDESRVVLEMNRYVFSPVSLSVSGVEMMTCESGPGPEESADILEAFSFCETIS